MKLLLIVLVLVMCFVLWCMLRMASLADEEVNKYFAGFTNKK